MENVLDQLADGVVCHYSDSLSCESNYHRHEGCEIYIFLAGDVKFYLEQQCYRLERGNVLVVGPGEYHRVELVDQTTYERVSVNFRTPHLAAFSSRRTDLGECFLNRPFGRNNLIQVKEQELRELIFLCRQLESAGESPLYGQDLMAVSYALQLLVKMNLLFQERGEADKPSTMPELVRDTMRYIGEHLTETISLKDLEHSLYHNGTYISRRFKNVTGLSVQQYILMKRVDLAKQHLRDGLSLMEACEQSGFNNYSNFSRTFTKLVGCPPKKYQSSFLKLQKIEISH